MMGVLQSVWHHVVLLVVLVALSACTEDCGQSEILSNTLIDDVNSQELGVIRVHGDDKDEMLDSCYEECCETVGCNVATLNDTASSHGVENCKLISCYPIEECYLVEKQRGYETIVIQRDTREADVIATTLATTTPAPGHAKGKGHGNSKSGSKSDKSDESDESDIFEETTPSSTTEIAMTTSAGLESTTVSMTTGNTLAITGSSTSSEEFNPSETSMTSSTTVESSSQATMTTEAGILESSTQSTSSSTTSGANSTSSLIPTTSLPEQTTTASVNPTTNVVTAEPSTVAETTSVTTTEATTTDYPTTESQTSVPTEWTSTYDEEGTTASTTTIQAPSGKNKHRKPSNTETSTSPIATTPFEETITTYDSNFTEVVQHGVAAGPKGPVIESPMTMAGLVTALTFGMLFFMAILVLGGKRLYDGWQRRHYQKVDYLVNGMYN